MNWHDSPWLRFRENRNLPADIAATDYADGIVVKARYTFTCRWNGHQWLITSHHSSTMREGE